MAKKKKKNNSLPPRHKRLKRLARLQAAKQWITKYEGKNIVRGYRKHFGVDWLCAVTELQMMGIEIDPEYVNRLRKTAGNLSKNKQGIKLQKMKKKLQDLYEDSDETFYYIAGYTPGGVPYGITWEEIGEELPDFNEICDIRK